MNDTYKELKKENDELKKEIRNIKIAIEENVTKKSFSLKQYHIILLITFPIIVVLCEWLFKGNEKFAIGILFMLVIQLVLISLLKYPSKRKKYKIFPEIDEDKNN